MVGTVIKAGYQWHPNPPPAFFFSKRQRCHNVLMREDGLDLLPSFPPPLCDHGRRSSPGGRGLLVKGTGPRTILIADSMKGQRTPASTHHHSCNVSVPACLPPHRREPTITVPLLASPPLLPQLTTTWGKRRACKRANHRLRRTPPDWLTNVRVTCTGFKKINK